MDDGVDDRSFRIRHVLDEVVRLVVVVVVEQPG
jgi:hypothetical protein